MKNHRVWPLVSAMLLLITMLVIWGCSKTSPIASSIDDTGNTPGSQTVSSEVERTRDGTGYSQRILRLKDLTFTVREGALNLPESESLSKDVELTVNTEVLPNGNWHFTFGPEGATFDPPAEVDINWPGASSADFTLFYIENGDYIAQPVADVEAGEESVRLYIHHFSEYELDDE